MMKRIILGAAVVFTFGLLSSPQAAAADGDVFYTLHECNDRALMDIAAAGGAGNLRAWCTEIHIVGAPVLGCTNPDGCLGDFWQEHTRPL